MPKSSLAKVLRFISFFLVAKSTPDVLVVEPLRLLFVHVIPIL